MRILTSVGYYLPGYKSGGPIRTIANLVDRLGDEFQFKIVTADRDSGDEKPYRNIKVADWNSVGNNNVEFTVANANTTTQVWDLTDPLNPQKMLSTLQGSDLKFVNSAIRLREYVAFNSSNFLIPISIGKINELRIPNLNGPS